MSGGRKADLNDPLETHRRRVFHWQLYAAVTGSAMAMATGTGAGMQDPATGPMPDLFTAISRNAPVLSRAPLAASTQSNAPTIEYGGVVPVYGRVSVIQPGEWVSIYGTNVADPVVVVDDILNSGNSLEKVRVILEEEKKIIALAFVLIDYHSPRGEAWRNKYGVRIRSPFSLAQFGLSIEKPEPPLRASFRNRWSFAAPDPNFFHRVPKSFPASDGKRVYFGSDCGTFWCLRAHDGSVAWKFNVNARGHKNLWVGTGAPRG
jgi:hypothetical protein